MQDQGSKQDPVYTIIVPSYLSKLRYDCGYYTVSPHTISDNEAL